jgi:hypothetical protein
MRRELFCVVKMGGLTRMGAALYAPGQEGMAFTKGNLVEYGEVIHPEHTGRRGRQRNLIGFQKED